MKILEICTVELKKNGIASHITNYYRELVKSNVNIDIACLEIDNKHSEYFKRMGSNVYVFPYRNRNFFKYIWQLHLIIKQNSYDIVHIHGNSYTMAIDLLASALGGCKIRITHSHNVVSSHLLFHYLLYPMFNFLCTHRFACSSAAGKWLYKNKNFYVILNPIDVIKFKFSKKKRIMIRAKYNIKDDETLFGHVGLFNEQKNHAFLIEIAKILKQRNLKFKFIFVGDGELIENVKIIIKNNKLEEYFIFAGTFEDVSPLLCAMDVFLFPSKWEGLGMALIEAQISGLLSVASTNVPKETKVSEKCYYISLESGASNWVDFIEKFSSKEMSARDRFVSLNNAMKYDSSTNAKKLLELYFSFLNK